MTRLIFDIETDGLLDTMTKIHCIVASDYDTGEFHQFGPDQIDEGVTLLAQADHLYAHNGYAFDVPAIRMIYPEFTIGGLTDTLLLSRLVYPHLRELDFGLRKKTPDYPGQLIGSHGLKAWGHRLKENKGDYADIRKAEAKELGLKGDEQTLYVWGTFTEDMMVYCKQDVVVTRVLLERIEARKPDLRSVELEHQVAEIIRRQESYGFAFDTTAAAELYATLAAKHNTLRDDLANTFPPWEVKTPFTPKRDNKTRGYTAGVTIDKVRTVEFNPDSRDHISQKLIEKYGWKPKDYTSEGKPKVDESVLAGLLYPEAAQLTEYLTLSKRIGQLSTGTQAWLKAEKKGRIHGRVNTNGATTGRMTHSTPNIAQVPASYAPYGKECRALFTASVGKVLVGCDADGLEGRCLAGYTAALDGGEFRDIILKGNKDDGTDLHSRNAAILGCDRDTAKTWFYAFIYGAGTAKLGSILLDTPRRGKQSRDQFFKAMPALRALVAGIKRRCSSRGYLTGIDGRRLYIRSEHAALNTLLQSAGAVLMKQGLVILDKDLQSTGMTPGMDYEFVANVHDEWQIETTKGTEHDVGQRAVRAIVDAGVHFGFGCPLDGNYQVGSTWAETH